MSSKDDIYYMQSYSLYSSYNDQMVQKSEQMNKYTEIDSMLLIGQLDLTA